MVEEGGRGAHYVAYVIEASYAFFVLGEDTVGEFGAEIFEWYEAVRCWIPGAKFEGVELENSGVARYKVFAWSTRVGDQDGHR